MVIRNLNALNVGAVVAIGGEDTLGVATKLHQMGVNVVGVPKTIDNDLSGTDSPSASTPRCRSPPRPSTGSIRRESHKPGDRLRGDGPPRRLDRHLLGHRGGADVILIPEKPIEIDRCASTSCGGNRSRGVNFSIVVVAEGAKLGVGREAR